jgi:hypothetical protein
MAHAEYSYVGDGSNRIFTVPFEYLNQDDVLVFFDGEPNGFDWLTTTTVETNGTPTEGMEVLFTRQTDIDEPAVDFVDGANLTEADLDRAVRQAFFGVQELRDDVTELAEDLAAAQIEAGNLPAYGGADIVFLVNTSGGGWETKTKAQVQTILEVPEEGGAFEPPSPVIGYPAMLTTNGLVYAWEGIEGARDFLNLGDLAVNDKSEFPLLDNDPQLDVGVEEDNLVQLIDVDDEGTIGLPAVDGSLLTGLPQEKYSRFDFRTAYNVDGGALGTGTWETIDLTSTHTNGIPSCEIDTGTDEITVNGGHVYRFLIRARVRAAGTTFLRVLADGSQLTRSPGSVGHEDLEKEVQLYHQAYFEEETVLKFQMYNTGGNGDAEAKGAAHGDSGLGENIFATVEIWRIPA